MHDSSVAVQGCAQEPCEAVLVMGGISWGLCKAVQSCAWLCMAVHVPSRIKEGYSKNQVMSQSGDHHVAVM
jgi:hypothetical protein